MPALGSGSSLLITVVNDARRPRLGELLKKEIPDRNRAEREGFEPSNEVNPRYAISSRARSAAPAPLQAFCVGSFGARPG